MTKTEDLSPKINVEEVERDAVLRPTTALSINKEEEEEAEEEKKPLLRKRKVVHREFYPQTDHPIHRTNFQSFEREIKELKDSAKKGDIRYFKLDTITDAIKARSPYSKQYIDIMYENTLSSTIRTFSCTWSDALNAAQELNLSELTELLQPIVKKDELDYNNFMKFSNCINEVINTNASQREKNLEIQGLDTSHIKQLETALKENSLYLINYFDLIADHEKVRTSIFGNLKFQNIKTDIQFWKELLNIAIDLNHRVATTYILRAKILNNEEGYIAIKEIYNKAKDAGKKVLQEACKINNITLPKDPSPQVNKPTSPKISQRIASSNEGRCPCCLIL
jgi:hypothetical protein